VKEKAKEKLKSKEENRISAKRTMPKVNASLAARLLTEPDKKRKSKSENPSKLLEDERFKKLWESPDFVIDENNPKFKFYYPKKKVGEAKIRGIVWCLTQCCGVASIG
jgi:ribosome biogenesis protein ENP2